jgi:hypothetical protein
MLVFGVMLLLGIAAACIVAPMYGHWEPDLAVAFWSVPVGIWYGVYRLRIRSRRRGTQDAP